MFGRDKPWKNADAAGLNDEIVIAAAIGSTPNFTHEKATPLRAIFGCSLLQRYDAMSQTCHVAVGVGSRSIIQQQRGTVPSGKILFERQNLAAIAQRSLRKQSQLRERVERDS